MDKLREIRDAVGYRNVREGDVFPDSPVPDRRILLSCEGRFKRVVNALIDAGLHPGPGAILFCTWRSPSYKGGGNLNGRETSWRREVLLSRGYIKNPVTGRWKGAT